MRTRTSCLAQCEAGKSRPAGHGGSRYLILSAYAKFGISRGSCNRTRPLKFKPPQPSPTDRRPSFVHDSSRHRATWVRSILPRNILRLNTFYPVRYAAAALATNPEKSAFKIRRSYYVTWFLNTVSPLSSFSCTWGVLTHPLQKYA
jgi:hypothetical protein